MPHGARNRGPCSGASFLRAGCPAATRSSGSIRVVWSVPLGQSALTAPLPREQSRCQRPFLWGIAQGRTGHPLLRGRCIPSYWVRDRGHVRGPRFCGADCPVAPFFGSIHDDDTRSSESSLQGPNLFDQVCTGHLASARFDRHRHWPSCHVGSPWPHSRFCASCSLTWRAIFPQPIFHSISPQF